MNMIYRNRRKNDAGKTWLVVFFVFFVLVFCSWVAFKYYTLKFEHRAIQASVEELADRGLMDGNHSIERAVMKLMSSYDADVEEDQIKLEVTQNKDKVTLEFPYKRILNFGFTKRKYSFFIHVERFPKKAAGALGDRIKQSIDRSMEKGGGRYNEAFQNP